MGKVVFVFPGQGSQYPGMGRELAEKYSAARAIFDEADKALGFSISKICFEGSEEELKQTEITQPAILTVSVAVLSVGPLITFGFLLIPPLTAHGFARNMPPRRRN